MLDPASPGYSIPIFPLPMLGQRPHSEWVANAVKTLELQENKQELSKRSLRTLAKSLAELDANYQVHGVDFSRAQLDILMRAANEGCSIEFETFGPYLADYIDKNGIIRVKDLTPEDAIGLELSGTVRRFFPSARLVSLYDEYNLQKQSTERTGASTQFTAQAKKNFRDSIIRLLQTTSAISDTAVDGTDFLLIPESTKVADAEYLVKRLERHNLLARDGNELSFINRKAENPLYRTIRLRTKQGKWLCEALDAAAFLKHENQKIIHLVILADYMKSQQDKVWEILRTLGIPLYNYHNIFYNPEMAPADTAATISSAFRAAAMYITETDYYGSDTYIAQAK